MGLQNTGLEKQIYSSKGQNRQMYIFLFSITKTSLRNVANIDIIMIKKINKHI